MLMDACVCMCEKNRDAKDRDAKDRDAKDRDAKDRDAKDRDAKDRSRRERGERDMARTQCSSRRGDAHKTAVVPLEGAGSSFLLFLGISVARE